MTGSGSSNFQEFLLAVGAVLLAMASDTLAFKAVQALSVRATQ
jgi:hypothetical protein